MIHYLETTHVTLLSLSKIKKYTDNVSNHTFSTTQCKRLPDTQINVNIVACGSSPPGKILIHLGLMDSQVQFLIRSRPHQLWIKSMHWRLMSHSHFHQKIQVQVASLGEWKLQIQLEITLHCFSEWHHMSFLAVMLIKYLYHLKFELRHRNAYFFSW